jgi:hypothetical protein
MTTQTLSRARAKRFTPPAAAPAWLGAVAFPVAAVWYGLAVRGVTAAGAPSPGPGVPAATALRQHYRWLATTLPQERLYLSVAIAGFASLALVATGVPGLLGRGRTAARAGAFGIGTGAALWIVGIVLQLGGHRAVGLMATHANPIEVTNSIAFTVDTVTEAFELAAFLLIGLGMLALAGAAARAGAGHRRWAGYTAAVAVVMIVIGWSYGAGDSGVTDALLVAGGVALLPLWLLWTSRISAPEAAGATPGTGGGAGT